MLSIYDDAINRFFLQLQWQGKSIPIVHAGADRAFAQIKNWLKTNRGIKEIQGSHDIPIPYPFIAIHLEEEVRNKNLNSNAILRQQGMIPDRLAGFGFAVRRPIPVIIGCEINFYFNDINQSKHIKYQLHNLFPSDIACVRVDFTDEKWYKPPNDIFTFVKIMGEQELRLQWENFTDNSQIEDSGLGERTIRKTLTVSLYGWVPLQPYAVPLVHKTEFQLTEQINNEIIETVTTTIEKGV